MKLGNQFTNSQTGFSYSLEDRVDVNPGIESSKVTHSSTTLMGAPGVRCSAYKQEDQKTGTIVSNSPGKPSLLKIGDLLTVNQVQTGIDNPSLVSLVLLEPSENETLSEYREDVLRAYRLPKKGGARPDYVLWSEQVQGVKKAYFFAGSPTGDMGEGWLIIESTDVNGLASSDLLNAVLSKIDSELPNSSPGISLSSIINQDLVVYVKGLSNVSNDDIDRAKSSIVSAIESYFNAVRTHLDGVDRSSERNDKIKRPELVNVVLDAVLPYGGFIEDAYWSFFERTRRVDRDKKFSLSNVVYVV